MIEEAWTYILASRPRGAIYIGVTRNLGRRVHDHRTGSFSSFARQYGISRLVLAERHDELTTAIAREKQLKNWRRAWKVNLIEATNPEWRDLFDEYCG
jgi:putative endonuclease